MIIPIQYNTNFKGESNCKYYGRYPVIHSSSGEGTSFFNSENIFGYREVTLDIYREETTVGWFGNKKVDWVLEDKGRTLYIYYCFCESEDIGGNVYIMILDKLILCEEDLK